MVSCVTFETSKVVDPILFYKATRVHLINYVKDEKDPDLQVYGDFCGEVMRQLREGMGMDDQQMVLHRRPVYDFSSMMEVLHQVLRSEKELDRMTRMCMSTFLPGQRSTPLPPPLPR
ncbi:MAG: hypothetical protein EOM68_28875 [Spirochaetia bacterium]|nr:hypothetical protein [Spirochaetia bacterium]